MIDEYALMLRSLEKGFRFRELRVVNPDPLIVGTERGLKRIRYWEDESLLEQHLRWRDRLKGGHFFLDRMHVTASGAPLIRFGRLALTCHDAPVDQAPLVGHERLWAQTVGDLLRRSRGAAAADSGSRLEWVERAYEQARQSGAFTDQSGKLLVSCYPYVRQRAVLCDRIRSRRGDQTFLLPRDFSWSDCKWIYGLLFIELGQLPPTDGYRSLGDFFLYVDLTEGDDCVRRLFRDLHEADVPLAEAVDGLRLAWQEPSEWMALAEQCASRQVAKDQTERFVQRWDNNVRMIRLLESELSDVVRPEGEVPNDGPLFNGDQSYSFSL